MATRTRQMSFRFTEEDLRRLDEIRAQHGFRSRAETVRFVMTAAGAIMRARQAADLMRAARL